MLEILSKEQEGLLWRTMETWFNNAYVRKDLNKDLIEDSICWLYSISGLKKPDIFYASSPLQCQSIASMIKTRTQQNRITTTNLERHIRDTIGKQFNSAPLLPDLVDRKIRERACDQLSLVREGGDLVEEHLRRVLKDTCEKFSRDGIAAFQWCGYHEFFEKIGVIKSNSSFDKYRNFIFDSGIFLSIYDKDHAIVCPNPSWAYFNKEIQLHSIDGPAISWGDGYKIFCLYGGAVNEETVMNNAEALRKHKHIKDSFEVYEKDGNFYVKR